MKTSKLDETHSLFSSQGFYDLMPKINFSHKVEEQHNIAQ